MPTMIEATRLPVRGTQTGREMAHAARVRRTDRATVKSFESFMRAYPPNEPYSWGRHTLAICRVLQRATEAVERGETYYGYVCCPPRHGKSDLTSRRYGVWHLRRNPTHEVILAMYGHELALDLGVDARRCAREVGLQLTPDRQLQHSWRTDEGGGYHAVGLEGAVTGFGAHVLVVDDYLKGIEAAESERERDNVWDAFRVELFSRLSPEGHACVVVANRWHERDLIGRIEAEAKENPAFPRFEAHVFPARDEESGEWLFPERFQATHYEKARAVFGAYWWSAIYQQNPQSREGGMLQTDRIVWHDSASEFPQDGLRWVRFWDLASTEKQRTKRDPDWTCGSKLGYRQLNGLPEVWVADVRRVRKTAPERDRMIREVAMRDGGGVEVAVETNGGYKDAGNYLRELLRGLRSMTDQPSDTDKVVRATPLEPVIEAGNFHCLRAEWNDAYEAELAAFPHGGHDDQVDATSGAYNFLKGKPDLWVL